MILRQLSCLCAAVLLTAISAQAQIAASLQLNRKQYISGEPVTATVTITNHTGGELILQNDPTSRTPWLDFMVKNHRGEPTPILSQAKFGALKIPSGQTMARQIVLNHYFPVIDVGSYSVYAIVRMPGQITEGTTTNRVTFNVSGGRPYWTQRVGVNGSTTRLREYRVLNYAGENTTQLYVQVMDVNLGQPVIAYSLGDVLMFRKPQMSVDKNQTLHVFFLSTPAMYTHVRIDLNGKLLTRQFHLRGPQGDPTLVAFGNGEIGITNSIPYDPKAAAAEKAKIRKASDRPTGF